MQTMMHKITFLAVSLLIVTAGFSQEKEKTEKQRIEPKFRKSKSFSKSYALSGSDKVSLSNQFGEMKINTWDKNEIKVDVSITGKADDETRAQQIVDRISIEDSKSGSTISFNTKFADDKWNRNENSNTNRNRNENRHDNENHNEGMEVNYTVYMPATATLKADNQFGKMIVPDFRGQVDLTSKFGSLTAGKLANTKEVNVEFGQADIASINGGDLSIKFSSGTINNVSGDVKCDLQFSTVKLVVDNQVKNLNINTSYTTAYLDLDKNISATYTINTSHGGFTNKTSFNIKEQNEEKGGYGPRFSHTYTGTSGSGGTKLTVHSSFGEVIAGHNMQVDVTEKKKNKSSTRVI
jgi:hypothetical protein